MQKKNIYQFILALLSVFTLLIVVVFFINLSIQPAFTIYRPPPFFQRKISSENNILAKSYFKETIIPSFEKKCRICHSTKQKRPSFQASPGIFDYQISRNYLLKGSIPEDSYLIKKISANPFHRGGNHCPDGMGTPLCQKISSWWFLLKEK